MEEMDDKDRIHRKKRKKKDEASYLRIINHHQRKLYNRGKSLEKIRVHTLEENVN